jgi:hypothetical protein
MVRKIWRERVGAFAKIVLVLGFVFSVLLTLAPAVIYAALLVMRLLFR